MNEPDLLSQLRDIAEPTAIGWWPPAPGWWLLAVLCVAAVIALVWWLVRRKRANRFRGRALDELDIIRQRFEQQRQPQTYLLELNALLKRVAITRYGRARVAPLHGRDWCRFLTEQASGVDFTEEPGALLGQQLYRPLADLPADRLQTLVATWIRRCK